MFGSSVLDVALGVVFIYLVLSLVCTAVNEWIASKINQRGKNLFEGIKNLLNDPQFTGLALLDILSVRGVVTTRPEAVTQSQQALTEAIAKLAANPADATLQQAVSAAQAALDQTKKAADVKQKLDDAEAARKVTKPSDTDKWNEATKAVQDALMAGRALAAKHPDPLGNIQRAVQNLDPGHARESLLVLIDKTKREVDFVEDQVQRLQENLEGWFNNAMDRVSGWYKRWTQKILLVLAFSVVVLANADTVMIAQRLTKDSALRASLVTTAEDAARLPSSPNDPTSSEGRLQPILEKAKSLDLPLGWSGKSTDPRHFPWDVQDKSEIPGSLLSKLLGLLISGFAVSLGAPFWFDTLSKIMNLRAAGARPGETKQSAPLKKTP